MWLFTDVMVALSSEQISTHGPASSIPIYFPTELHFSISANDSTGIFFCLYFQYSVNIVIPNSKSVVAEAIKLAQEITANSPDAVQAAKHGLLLSQNLYPMEEVVLAHVWSRHSERLYEGRNIKEGLQAFAAVCAQIFF